MLSLRRGSVARRLRVLTDCAREKVRARQWHRERAAAVASIRAALEIAGLDPAHNPGVTRFRDSEALMARLGDTPERRRADADFVAQDPELAKRRSLLAAALERAPLPAAWPPPDPVGLGDIGSPLHWYLWALQTLSGTAAENGDACQPATA